MWLPTAILLLIGSICLVLGKAVKNATSHHIVKREIESEGPFVREANADPPGPFTAPPYPQDPMTAPSYPQDPVTAPSYPQDPITAPSYPQDPVTAPPYPIDPVTVPDDIDVTIPTIPEEPTTVPTTPEDSDVTVPTNPDAPTTSEDSDVTVPTNPDEPTTSEDSDVTVPTNPDEPTTSEDSDVTVSTNPDEPTTPAPVTVPTDSDVTKSSNPEGPDVTMPTNPATVSTNPDEVWQTPTPKDPLVYTSEPGKPEGKCQEGWAAHNGYCYKISPASIGYFRAQEAELLCQSWNSHLCSIHSTEENDFIFELVSNNNGRIEDGAHIGYRCTSGITGWWTDGSYVDFKMGYYNNECLKFSTHGFPGNTTTDKRWLNYPMGHQERACCKKRM